MDMIPQILMSCHRVAVVGLSSHHHRPGYYVPEYLAARGYEIIPVNPHLDNALGQSAYASLQMVPRPVDLVLIFRRVEYVPAIVEQAITIQARALWMQLGIRHEAAAERARDAGISVVMDACMMVEHRHWVKSREGL